MENKVQRQGTRKEDGGRSDMVLSRRSGTDGDVVFLVCFRLTHVITNVTTDSCDETILMIERLSKKKSFPWRALLS